MWLYSLDIIAGSLLMVWLLKNYDTDDAAANFLAYAEVC
jgi:hypothetical protein